MDRVPLLQADLRLQPVRIAAVRALRAGPPAGRGLPFLEHLRRGAVLPPRASADRRASVRAELPALDDDLGRGALVPRRPRLRRHLPRRVGGPVEAPARRLVPDENRGRDDRPGSGRFDGRRRNPAPAAVYRRPVHRHRDRPSPGPAGRRLPGLEIRGRHFLPALSEPVDRNARGDPGLQQARLAHGIRGAAPDGRDRRGDREPALPDGGRAGAPGAGPVLHERTRTRRRSHGSRAGAGRYRRRNPLPPESADGDFVFKNQRRPGRRV